MKKSIIMYIYFLIISIFIFWSTFWFESYDEAYKDLQEKWTDLVKKMDDWKYTSEKALDRLEEIYDEWWYNKYKKDWILYIYYKIEDRIFLYDKLMTNFNHKANRVREKYDKFILTWMDNKEYYDKYNDNETETEDKNEDKSNLILTWDSQQLTWDDEILTWDTIKKDEDQSSELTELDSRELLNKNDALVLLKDYYNYYIKNYPSFTDSFTRLYQNYYLELQKQIFEDFDYSNKMLTWDEYIDYLTWEKWDQIIDRLDMDFDPSQARKDIKKDYTFIKNILRSRWKEMPESVKDAYNKYMYRVEEFYDVQDDVLKKWQKILHEQETWELTAVEAYNSFERLLKEEVVKYPYYDNVLRHNLDSLKSDMLIWADTDIIEEVNEYKQKLINKANKAIEIIQKIANKKETLEAMIFYRNLILEIWKFLDKVEKEEHIILLGLLSDWVMDLVDNVRTLSWSSDKPDFVLGEYEVKISTWDYYYDINFNLCNVWYTWFDSQKSDISLSISWLIGLNDWSNTELLIWNNENEKALKIDLDIWIFYKNFCFIQALGISDKKFDEWSFKSILLDVEIETENVVENNPNNNSIQYVIPIEDFLKLEGEK